MCIWWTEPMTYGFFSVRVTNEARRNTKTKHEKWAKYYNQRRRDIRIKVKDWVLVKTHPLSSAVQKMVARFKPKFEGPYKVLEVKQNNLVVCRSGKRITVNVDQVRLYHHRKSNEMETRTSSSDNNSSSYKSNNFKGLQPRSNESQYSRKNGSGKRHELEEKGRGLKKDQGERHTSTSSNRRPPVRSSTGSCTEPNRKVKMGRKETLAYKRSLDVCV
ncbi:uncharacterized protein TNCV_1798241 [Trichonephila clavipes]|uniref:Uncharacterized protein n=1 Tax=Trichonephila clavipes TaxID=2585209 RepID=A0A8X6SNR3_TRICX|nr:uncharacterized protein TNCV_1798241 [Trichonephila clavipes]